MPIKLPVLKHNLCRYLELYEITEWKANSVFKTRKLGHISYMDEKEVLALKWFGRPKYATSGISTHITTNCAVNEVLTIYTPEEL